MKQRNRRGSDSSIRSSQQYEPLIKVNAHASKRDNNKMSFAKAGSIANNDESLKKISLSKKLTLKRKKNNQDDEEDDEDYDV